MYRSTLFSVGAVALLSACANPPAPPAAPDLAAAERGVRAADSVWMVAATARDAAGEGAMIASNGVAYRNLAEPISGPAAYQEFQAKFYAENPRGTSSWTTTSITVAASGDMAIQTGNYVTAGLGPKGDREEKGHFVTVWRLDGGQWKVAIDIGQEVRPPAAK